MNRGNKTRQFDGVQLESGKKEIVAEIYSRRLKVGRGEIENERERECSPLMAALSTLGQGEREAENWPVVFASWQIVQLAAELERRAIPGPLSHFPSTNLRLIDL